jgi:hypothetical protein
MRKIWLNKGLVLGIIWLVVGISLYSVGSSQLELKGMNTRDMKAPFMRTTLLEKNVLNSMNLFNNEGQHQLYQSLNTSFGLYLIISSSGSGRALHLFIKIPHIRNSKGFFIAGVIVYTGLTALTTVMQYTNKTTNGTAWKIVDVGVGPHMVVFFGFGYSTFQRNIKHGGGGKMIGVTVIKPLIFP